MELRTLRYFLTAANEGNITRAAEILHVTQPTLSRQLMELERELETTLVIRGKKGLTLTDDGYFFRQRAEEIVSLADRLEQSFAQRNETVSGVISLGATEVVGFRLLAKVIKEFSQKHPMIHFRLYNEMADVIRERIDKGLVDIGLLMEPVDIGKYNFFRFPQRDTWGVLVRRDDPLAQRESIGKEELLALPLSLPRREIVQDSIASWFGVERSQLHIFAQHTLLNNAALLVEAGLCYVVCVRGSFTICGKPSLCFRPFAPARTTGHVLAWKKNRIFHPAASCFRAYIREKQAAL